MLALADCALERLADPLIGSFDCGDPDLNEFLVDDAMPHQIQLLTVTYLIKFQKKAVGTQGLDYIKMLFVNGNKTGCRFITVDAYERAIPFYTRNGFKPLSEHPENGRTKQMFFDLKTIL